ncbi:MAG: MarR family winged helix-turn-helix transcriptional regulator [Beijerinckiaceae bacterium]
MTDLSKKELRAWTRLQMVHGRVTGLLERALASDGLPPLDWYGLLTALGRVPASGARPFELEQATGEAQYTVSRLLDRMAREGLVIRNACEDDRRGALVSLSDKGAGTLANMRETCQRVLQQEFVDLLSGKKVKALDGMLGDLLPERRTSPD